MSKEIVLVGACRTAIGKMGGTLSNIPAEQLGAIVMRKRSPAPESLPIRSTRLFSATS